MVKFQLSITQVMKEKNQMNGILASFSHKNVIHALFESIQSMPFKYRGHHEISIAALEAGNIQKKEFVKPNYPEEEVSSFDQNLTASLTLACIREKRQEQTSHVHLATSRDIAVAYHGFINNISDIREQLFQLGYEVDRLSPSELIVYFIRRYLDVPMPVREASLTAIRRLNGEFALIALFAEQNSIMIAQNGMPMTLSMKKNEVYIASNTAGCLVHPTMFLEEDSLLILRSLQK
jgi:glutamine---fructose-6-phosphate transaminase (isomerizing)